MAECGTSMIKVGRPSKLEPTDPSQVSSLSKTAQKKLSRAQRQESLKPLRRQLEKQRRRLKKASRNIVDQPVERLRPFDATVVLDLGFDALMTDKEIASMASQLTIVYARNRHAKQAFHSLILCGEGGQDSSLMPIACETDHSNDLSLLHSRLGRRMENKMNGNWQRWSNVSICNTGGLGSLLDNDKFPKCSKQNIIYLTADTENTLDELREGNVYVIGGLVDRNRHKNICARKAEMLGLQTAKLPIPPQKLKTSTILTVNQVFEIMLRWLQSRDWNDALDACLPSRKLKEGTQSATAPEASSDDVLLNDLPDEDALRNEM